MNTKGLGKCMMGSVLWISLYKSFPQCLRVVSFALAIAMEPHIPSFPSQSAPHKFKCFGINRILFHTSITLPGVLTGELNPFT
jgi:hypothetical protein